MGCGKSSVGRELSKLLCCPFMDLDAVIEETHGRRIPEIFATDGEAAFRAMEVETLRDIISHCGHTAECQFRTNVLTPECHPERSEGSADLVLALGGGTVMTPRWAELVHENTLCIYLRASVQTLVSHLGNEAAGRPLLEASDLQERILTLMSIRSTTYEKTAHIIIDTDGKSIEAIASEIISLLKGKNYTL